MVNQGDDMQKEIRDLIVFLLRVDIGRVLKPNGSVEPANLLLFSLCLSLCPPPRHLRSPPLVYGARPVSPGPRWRRHSGSAGFSAGPPPPAGGWPSAPPVLAAYPPQIGSELG